MANREPGEKTVFEAREIIDSGFLELVRYGIRRADDPLIVDSLKVVDHVLKRQTSRGPCWRRYNHDGYGQRKDGGPYEGYGQGRSWPLLTGERGHYELAAGHDPQPYIMAMERFASKGGMLPEQVWDDDDIPAAGMFRGEPAGSAQPLVWAHAEYLKLLRSAVDGEVFDCIGAAKQRYGVPTEKRTFRSELEFYKLRRPVEAIAAGITLRVIHGERFRLVYTTDGWASQVTIESTQVGYAGSYADVPTKPGKACQIEMTLYWPAEDKWLGHNLTVAVLAG